MLYKSSKSSKSSQKRIQINNITSYLVYCRGFNKILEWDLNVLESDKNRPGISGIYTLSLTSVNIRVLEIEEFFYIHTKKHYFYQKNFLRFIRQELGISRKIYTKKVVNLKPIEGYSDSEKCPHRAIEESKKC